MNGAAQRHQVAALRVEGLHPLDDRVVTDHALELQRAAVAAREADEGPIVDEAGGGEALAVGRQRELHATALARSSQPPS